MDAATGNIRAVKFTSSHQGDSPILPDLLSQISATKDIESVTAEGVYGTPRCHTPIFECGAEPIIPIRYFRDWHFAIPPFGNLDPVLETQVRIAAAH